MEPPDDNEPVVKVASAASKQTQRERSFLETRILFHGHATCHESWKEGPIDCRRACPSNEYVVIKNIKIFYVRVVAETRLENWRQARSALNARISQKRW